MEVPPEILGLRTFEAELITRFKVFDPKVGGGKSLPRKGPWIRNHLLEVGADYPYGMFKRWSTFVDIAHENGARIPKGNYGSFLTYIWLLEINGLIRFVREAPGLKSQFHLRKYYEPVRLRLRDPLWRNPYTTYESYETWKRRKFKRPGVPKKRRPRGRPRKY